jgi:hypothetical protein
MAQSRDPSRAAEVPERMHQLAKISNGVVVVVTCVDRAANEVVQFPAVMPSLPAKGNRIALENKRVCEVTGILFVPSRAEDQLIFVAHVAADLVEDGD